MLRIRPYIFANLSAWARLPTGSPDAVDQLRQQLHALGIAQDDRRAILLAARALALAEDLHAGIGNEPEYVKRARLNIALARLCRYLETRAGSDFVEQASRSTQHAGSKEAC